MPSMCAVSFAIESASATQQKAAIGPAKSERVAQGVAHPSRSIRNQVLDAQCGIELARIDAARRKIMLQRERADHRLERPSRTQGMARRSLG